MPYTVFPLHPLKSDGTCGCSEGASCPRPGKHPAIRWGELAPGEQHFGPAGHAIATGARSGVFVVDTDGAEADARFHAHGDVGDTFKVRTPREGGGFHYYFTAPGFPVQNSQGEFDKREGEKTSKIDVRGDGGFVVMPGSPHVSGRTYEVERNVAPGPAPAWLLEWPGLRGRSIVEGDSMFRPIPVDVSTILGQSRLAMGRESCETFPPSIAGQNGSGALWAISLRLVRDLELPIEVCAELVATVFNARCEPPWSPAEVEHKLIDARDKSDTMPGNLTPIDTSKFSAPISVPKSVRKRDRDAAHVYECKVGDVPNGGKSKTSLANALSILRSNPSWDGVLQYDAFRDRVLAVDPPIPLDAETTGFSDGDVVAIRTWFELVGGLLVSKDLAWEAAIQVAKANAFHPVREWLNDLDHVDGSFLDSAAEHIFGSTDPLEAVCLRRFLVAAVRRIMHPGTKVDTMLVLAGPQGVGKSTFVRALFGEDWTAEDLPDLASKDAVVALAGNWAVEIAELDKIMRTEAETAKAFLSRCVDKYRPPYGRAQVERPRDNVFVGTTNRDDILRDATGSRRYWIVEVKSVDLAWLRANRESLWAAAVDLVRRGEQHWLTADEDAARETRSKDWEERDPWHEAIVTYCTARPTVRVEDVFRHVGGSTEKLDGKVQSRIMNTLRRLGCIARVTGKYRVRLWHVPEYLQQAEVSGEEKVRRASEQAVINLLKN